MLKENYTKWYGEIAGRNEYWAGKFVGKHKIIWTAKTMIIISCEV